MAVATQALKQQVFQLFDRGVVIDSIPDRVPVSRQLSSGFVVNGDNSSKLLNNLPHRQTKAPIGQW
jgi:hypothetical protein